MTDSKQDVKYFIFDVESVSDGNLIRRVRYQDEVTDAEAVARYRAELMASQGHDFIPYTYQFPVAVVIAKVRWDYRLIDIVALDEPLFRPHVITRHFWHGWEVYKQPTFVSFNGRGFDMPLMELAAFKYGISAPAWFNDRLRTYEQPRNRYNTNAHLDLQDLMVNYGASRFNGGLNLAATVLGKPGKIDVQGDMVQDMYNEQKLDAINAYCRCDVLDTYFVFLRTRVLIGKITLEQELEIIAETRQWLIEHSDSSIGYATYLEHWDDWINPWIASESTESVKTDDQPSSCGEQVPDDLERNPAPPSARESATETSCAAEEPASRNNPAADSAAR